MQSWETFVGKHPRLRLQTYFSRRGLKSVASAIQHFRDMGVNPSAEVLEEFFNPPKSNKSDTKTSSTLESSDKSAEISAGSTPPANPIEAEPIKTVDSTKFANEDNSKPRATVRRTSARRKKTSDESSG